MLLVKAAAVALTQHPVVNASCRDGKSFSYNNNVNIGVAVALEGGLLTPVLEDADKVGAYCSGCVLVVKQCILGYEWIVECIQFKSTK